MRRKNDYYSSKEECKKITTTILSFRKKGYTRKIENESPGKVISPAKGKTFLKHGIEPQFQNLVEKFSVNMKENHTLINSFTKKEKSQTIENSSL